MLRMHLIRFQPFEVFEHGVERNIVRIVRVNHIEGDLRLFHQAIRLEGKRGELAGQFVPPGIGGSLFQLEQDDMAYQFVFLAARRCWAASISRIMLETAAGNPA